MEHYTMVTESINIISRGLENTMAVLPAIGGFWDRNLPCLRHLPGVAGGKPEPDRCDEARMISHDEK
jgi:hypothetical protein